MFTHPDYDGSRPNFSILFKNVFDYTIQYTSSASLSYSNVGMIIYTLFLTTVTVAATDMYSAVSAF